MKQIKKTRIRAFQTPRKVFRLLEKKEARVHRRGRGFSMAALLFLFASSSSAPALVGRFIALLVVLAARGNVGRIVAGVLP